RQDISTDGLGVRRRVRHRCAPKARTGLAQPAALGGAAAALPQVALHRNLLIDRQLTVVVGLEHTTRRAAGPGLHCTRSCSTARSAWRARVRRDFTVPSVTLSE